LHSDLLGLHHLRLLVRVIAGNSDSYNADSGGNPKPDSLGKLKPKSSTLQPETQFFYTTVKAICALGLIFGSSILLSYSLKRSDYLLTLRVLHGFSPFAFGIVLLLSVLGFIH
jgi:hypothetical protein